MRPIDRIGEWLAAFCVISLAPALFWIAHVLNWLAP